MGKLIISTAMTVDGVMTVEEWFVAEGEHDRASRAQFDGAAGFVLGRKNYEGLAGYWEPMTGEWADLINPIPKFVASRTLEGPLTWNATLIEGELLEAVAKLKEELDGDLFSFGCGELSRELVVGGLVDELRFWLHPVVWGRGERPFREDEKIRLKLLGAEAYDSGVTLLRYEPVSG